MPVYLDVLVLINFLVDLLLLLGTNRLAGHPPDIKRALPAAALGGIYGGACVLPGIRFLSGTFWRITVLALMAVIAFGCRRDAVRRGILFILLSMALGGVAMGMTGGGFWTLVLSAAAICAMCLLGFRGKVGAEYVSVELAGLHLTALRDTGNSLTDPITGQQVLVVSASAGAALLGVSAEELRDPVRGVEKVAGARLIPYHTVGNSALLLAKRYENVIISGKSVRCLVAFAPEEIGQGKPYEALMGGAL
ncbi:MAG: hypothetical protein E7466_00245 [Ruminococcaceae bacterium]|nr:hypothetical protein [Oscillospiraceae bacterium]